MRYRIACGAIALLSLASLGLQCGPELGDCFRFRNSRLEVALVGSYTDAHAGFSNGEIAPWDAPSCGAIDTFPAPLAFEVVRSFERTGCNEAYAHLDVGPIGVSSVDWEALGSRHEIYAHIQGSELEQTFYAADVAAQSVVELEGGCTGLYSVFLHNDGKDPNGDDLLDPPNPAVRSYWLVTRVFEPWQDCEGLPSEQSLCADTWVAQLLSRTPR